MKAVAKPKGGGLAPQERADLARLEMIVSQGIAAFDAVGRALLEIRDRKLYRESHKDFDDYCRRRWGFGKSRGYQLIEAAETAANLKVESSSSKSSTNGGQTRPANERQMRPLAGLSPDAQREAWAEAVGASGGNPTAEDVAEAVESLNLPPDPLEEHQRRSAALKDAADRASPPRDDRKRRLLKILHYARQIKRCARGLGGEGEDLEELADKQLSIAEDFLAT